MSSPINHKTVFVMDHGPHFGMPCQQIEMDFKSSVPHGAALIPLSPVVKTIWTSAIESVMEYVRLVYDIFPSDSDELKLLRMVVSDTQETTQILNSWRGEDQSSAALSAGLALVGPPGRRTDHVSHKDFDLSFGLTKALQALCELTPLQQRIAQRQEGGRLLNRGRIVLLTYLLDKERLKESFIKLVSSVNQVVEASETFAPLDQVELDVVHCFPPAHMPQDPQHLMNLNLIDPCRGISIKIVSVSAGADLSKKLLCLALRHYDLASTTVTGIPMKEEQNASSSANYDVELFHKASAHTKLFSFDGYSATAPVDLQSWMPQTIKEGCEYKTVTLKWCTPRGSSGSELQHCITTARITPTDVNSRPSSCLTNFLLAGRSVMLEMPRRTGSKILSHMLTSHAGEIFIHTLAVARSVLEDPPSITEVPGGRVTDYRITDLGELMKLNLLAPHYGESKAGVPDPIDKAAKRLSRYTLFCPLTISSTTILNMSAITPLYNIMLKEEVTEENLAECRKVIYNLLSMENKGDPLPVALTQANPTSKVKTPKKEEQYKMMFSELEKFLAAHCHTDRHQKVLDCLLEVRNRTSASRSKDGGEKVELDVALREIERYSSRTDEDTSPRQSGTSAALLLATAPVVPPKRPKLGGGQSLLDIFKNRLEKENASGILPFAGMRSIGEKAKLYLSLEKKDTPDGPPPPPMDM